MKRWKNTTVSHSFLNKNKFKALHGYQKRVDYSHDRSGCD